MENMRSLSGNSRVELQCPCKLIMLLLKIRWLVSESWSHSSELILRRYLSAWYGVDNRRKGLCIVGNAGRGDETHCQVKNINRWGTMKCEVRPEIFASTSDVTWTIIYCSSSLNWTLAVRQDKIITSSRQIDEDAICSFSNSTSHAITQASAPCTAEQLNRHN